MKSKDNEKKILNQKTFNRKSIRLKGYDYSKPGGYFITICTKNHKCLFGKIHKGKMILNNLGKTIRSKLIKLENYFLNLELDLFQIMPNHIHIIFILTDKNKNVGAGLCPCPKNKTGQPQRVAPTIGSIVGMYKSITAIEYLKINKSKKKYPDNLWQRNYFEHVIKNEVELNEIRQYIFNNPKNWENDHYYKKM